MAKSSGSAIWSGEKGEKRNMMQKPIIIINTDNYTKFCENRCGNTECRMHISHLADYRGGVRILKLRDTEDCRGYMPKPRKKRKA